MNRKSQYADMEKFRVTRNKQKRRYYGKTALYGRRTWTEDESSLVMAHEIPDMELSFKINRSVAAIQNHRYQQQKKMNRRENDGTVV